MVTSIIAITALIPDVREESSPPYPVMDIGAVNKISNPPPTMIKTHITNINEKMCAPFIFLFPS